MKLRFTATEITEHNFEIDLESYDYPEDKVEFAEWYAEFKQEVLNDPKSFIEESDNAPIQEIKDVIVSLKSE